MASTKQQTKSENAITLKGSAKLVSDFFFYGINSILYQRGIYPPDDFNHEKQYGLTVFVTTDEGVKDYLEQVLNQIKDWLEAGQIERLVLAISNVDTKEVLERWDFTIHHEKEDKSSEPSTPKKIGDKELKEIQKEMRDVIRQITACVTFLPLLDCLCSFDLLVYTHQSCDVPEKWGNSTSCLIANSEEVRLKSFSTSVHKVETCVSYKA